VLADFTALGLSAPAGLWNLGDTTDVSGNGRALTNKGAVPFGVGVNGLSTTAAVFAGSTGQALYIADTGAADSFRIKTGSFGAWVRTAKRGTTQAIVGKIGGAVLAYLLQITPANVGSVLVSVDGAAWANTGFVGVSDVADDRWHHIVATVDGTTVRLYVDGAPEASVGVAGPIFTGGGPFNLGAYNADGATAAAAPFYGRVDEAFVTADVLTDDQVRLLYCAKLAHTLGAVPTRARLNVIRRRRGTALVVADFPAAPVRLHNFTAGSLNDEGTGGIALTASGAVVDVGGADGVVNGAKSFAAGVYLASTDAGLPAGTSARTYGCWFKTTVAAVQQGMFGWGGGGGTACGAWLGNTSTGAIGSQSVGDLMSGPFVCDGQWHHAAVVEDNAAGDGVRRKLYLDGRLVAGSTVLNAITLGGANRFRLGVLPDNTLLFTGQVDGVFIYAGALTFEQVAALYAKGTQPLGPSPKEHGAHVEGWDNSFVYTTFDTLDSQYQVDLAVAA
jgi:hypothetical protein